MRHLLPLTLLLALAGAGAALATHGDPQREIVPADQARAKAMLLRKTDLGPGFKAAKATSDDEDSYCQALDESDLTLTGEAESPNLERGVAFVGALAQVYETRADANSSWRRGTSAAGEKCARDEFRKRFATDGIRLVSFRRVSFPRLAERGVAYRMIATSQGVRVYFDIVVLQKSRAQAALLFGSALTAVPRSDQIRLAAVIAARMTTAMRGS